MAIYSKHLLLNGPSSAIENIARAIKEEFSADGFEVMIEDLVSGGADISITKGGVFKAVLGMKSAMKISLIPSPGGIVFDANVGIWGQQVIPALIAWYVTWPVLVTQIWGLIQQSKLDDKALEIAQRIISTDRTPLYSEQSTKYCPGCGSPLQSSNANFCVNCGSKL